MKIKKQAKRTKSVDRALAEAAKTERRKRKSAVREEPEPQSTAPVVTTEQADGPHPEFLLMEAAKETNHRFLDEYSETIDMLRDEKQFTFREIAAWLQNYGIQADHNAVYRIYTKGMSDQEARQAEYENHEDEREET